VAGKKKILGLNAASLYDIKVPDEFQLPASAGTPGAQEVLGQEQPVAGA